MSPPETLDGPTIVSSYIPHFYRYEHARAYEFRWSGPVYGSNGAHTSSSDRPFSANPDQPQTVEQIISNGYFTVPTGDPVTALITDKGHTSWLGLDDVIGQIRQRYEIHDRNIYEIELAKCGAVNVFLVHYDHNKPDAPDDRIYYSLNKNLQRLYQDQRDERVNLWRDISKLRETLPENIQRYLSVTRKLSVLEDIEGDAP